MSASDKQRHDARRERARATARIEFAPLQTVVLFFARGGYVRNADGVAVATQEGSVVLRGGRRYAFAGGKWSLVEGVEVAA